MRLCLTLSANRQPVPFSYQHFLTSAFHRWLGPNAVHDAMSLYSLSWLRGDNSFVRQGYLQFPRGAQWRISAHDPALLQKIIEGSLRGPEVCCGMRVETVEQLPCPTFGERHTFRLLSPILAKSRPDAEGRVTHHLWDDPQADAIITATLRHKMDSAGLDERHKTATVRFDRDYPNPKTKLVNIKGIEHKTSLCPVIIEGTPEALLFSWHVGIGNNTGSGFGCLE
jgi:CRISPR-associated endoribonuclease Cas6